MSYEPPQVPQHAVEADVARALAEDIGSGDLTAALLPAGETAVATITAKQDAVLAGEAWAQRCFESLDPGARVQWLRRDGQRVTHGDVICRIEGEARALVSAERSALNFLQTLSATATITQAFVQAVHGSRARILDTRKTLPGLRLAQKYAVRCGGGHNHRIGLFDAILVKENHIAAAGSIAAAVTRARAIAPGVFCEVEVEDLDELAQALAAGADRILIDDFTLDDMRQAVQRAGGRCPLEVSGGVSLGTVAAIAATGVDCISVGALTKNVQAIDLSMRIAPR